MILFSDSAMILEFPKVDFFFSSPLFSMVSCSHFLMGSSFFTYFRAGGEMSSIFSGPDRCLHPAQVLYWPVETRSGSSALCREGVWGLRRQSFQIS